MRQTISLPSASTEISTNGRWLIYIALGHMMQIWDLAKLETEVKKLNLPWRAPPHTEIQPDPRR